MHRVALLVAPFAPPGTPLFPCIFLLLHTSSLILVGSALEIKISRETKNLGSGQAQYD
ncbi:hypothetical protein BCR43DRAFT_125539 [Syncephalastrum racemosum]|uniref:Uncharacterized protein n=1 Tax=Syncephalastrum racemosum TaxID=13706 RepID=A0A1X2HKT1_SYNRA|nr:hypothetical protein BCR43DRAFT_125539 [Syncephalastrum racemosum]